MTSLLIALLVVLVIPLLVASWRTSLLGLSLQGLLLGGIAWRQAGGAVSVDLVILLVDLVVLRAVVAPWALYRVLADRRAPARNDMLPPNLLAWTAVGVLILLGFRVASALVPYEGDPQTLVAVAASALLLGFLVLSTQVGVFSQIVGVLRLENAIALLEIGLHHPAGPALHVGQMLVYLASVAAFRWYLDRLAPDPRVTA